MNRFAAAHPEDWEERIEAWRDAGRQLRKEDMEKSVCVVCGEPTMGRQWCKRCQTSMEEDRLNRGE